METTKSEQTPKQIAEQAWIEQSTKPTKFDDPFIQGISDYKQALREDVQKRINAYPDFQQRNMAQDSAVATLKELLELIETVTPKE